MRKIGLRLLCLAPAIILAVIGYRIYVGRPSPTARRRSLSREAFEATFRERGLPVPESDPREGYWGDRLKRKTPDRRLGWRETADRRPGRVEVDEQGCQHFRSDAPPRARILILGGSVAWGAYASSDQTVYFAALGRVLEDGLSPGAPMVASDVGSARYMPHFVLITMAGRLLSFDALQTLGLAALGVFGIGWLFYLRRHLFIAFGALVMLVPFVANFFVRIPLGSRFILLAVFFLHVALVWMLLMITPGYHERSSPLRRPRAASFLVAIVLLLMFAHNIRMTTLRLGRELEGRTPGRPTAVVQYGQRVGEIAEKGAVVLGQRADCWPLPTFGVKVVALEHINPLLPDHSSRVDDVSEFFKPDTSAARREEIVRRYGVSHVVVRGDLPKPLAHWLREKSADRQAVPNGYELYTLRYP